MRGANGRQDQDVPAVAGKGGEGAPVAEGPFRRQQVHGLAVAAFELARGDEGAPLVKDCLDGEGVVPHKELAAQLNVTHLWGTFWLAPFPCAINALPKCVRSVFSKGRRIS